MWSYPGSGPRPTNDSPKVMLATLPSYPAMLDIEGVQGVEEISLIGGNVRLEAAKYARWILLWGMALAGSGHVPPELLAEPWTEPANRPEKYFEPAPAAMWVISITGQRDRATVDVLIERLEWDEPLWLRGDAIGALGAVTGQRFGYKVAEWLDWWRGARDHFPIK